jgi:hypothetical protein
MFTTSNISMLASPETGIYPPWLVRRASDRKTGVTALSTNLYFGGKNPEAGLRRRTCESRSELNIPEFEASATWNHRERTVI